MTGTFRMSADVPVDVEPWGKLRWMSHPPSTGAAQLTVIEVTLSPGNGHNFHKHPDQEEVIYCLSGQVEQWLGQEKRVLVAGDSVFIKANVVHASFNLGGEDAKLLAILGPCVGAQGYELVDVSDQAPWSGLRGDDTQ